MPAGVPEGPQVRGPRPTGGVAPAFARHADAEKVRAGGTLTRLKIVGAVREGLFSIEKVRARAALDPAAPRRV